MSKKFSLGEVFLTSGVASFMKEYDIPYSEITNLLNRHANGDWGNLSENDKEMNEQALRSGNDRILSKYKLLFEDVYVITESDRSYTTIMFPSEY